MKEILLVIGCPNPFDVELTPDMVQLGEQLSEEIANIQNSLQARGFPESDTSILSTDAAEPPQKRLGNS